MAASWLARRSGQRRRCRGRLRGGSCARRPSPAPPRPGSRRRDRARSPAWRWPRSSSPRAGRRARGARPGSPRAAAGSPGRGRPCDAAASRRRQGLTTPPWRGALLVLMHIPRDRRVVLTGRQTRYGQNTFAAVKRLKDLGVTPEHCASDHDGGYPTQGRQSEHTSPICRAGLLGSPGLSDVHLEEEATSGRSQPRTSLRIALTQSRPSAPPSAVTLGSC